MYRIEKVLNHITVIVIETDKSEEFLVVSKGVGFGRKVAEFIEIAEDAKVYSLSEMTERGNAKELVKQVPPQYLEIANEVVKSAENVFSDIDKSIIFPLADHLEFAVKRIRAHEDISNPLLDDIKVLFHAEYKAAECVRPILLKEIGTEVSDDEIGYIALHIHSAISSDKISQSVQIAKAVRECVSIIQDQTGKKISVDSLSYNRMMNHIRYMVARVQHDEPLKLDMNEMVSSNYPESFEMSRKICDGLGESLGVKLDEKEIGYLAIHIERVKAAEG
jgi:transcriptional antiterminator